MSDLNKKYKDIINDLEKNITNPKDLEIAKNKVTEMMIEISSSISEINNLKNNQEILENRLNKIQKTIDTIKNDMYITDGDEDDSYDEMHDNDYEFEITCPFCNYSFVTDNSYFNQTYIQCPKCKKTIELDWGTTPVCEGDCDGCMNHCYEEKKENNNTSKEELNTVQENGEKYNSNEKNNSNKNQKDNKNNENEDDM